tara:strand:- start:1232 stop:2170 length:939 start_codon:yes stop_codon:yes gene_type:complete
MLIIRKLEELEEIKSSVVTIGSYDGLHIGHLDILNKTISHSKKLKYPSILITFEPHPKQVLDPNINDGFLLSSFDDKMTLIKKAGIDFVFIITFNKKFSEMTAQKFLEGIIKKSFNPKAIVIGYNHHFGYNRTGNSQFLNEFCSRNNIILDIVNPVKSKGEIVSSSYIRTLIRSGKVNSVKYFLGRFYGYNGTICKGSGRGSKLDFPTANIISSEKMQIMPMKGVYFVSISIVGLELYGMCNFGSRPTFKENELIMEVNIFHKFGQDLYGKNIGIKFLVKIRDEVAFKSSGELKNQLIKDKSKCLSLQKKYG